MRNFSSFLHRRKVDDLSSWFSANNIKSVNDLENFCKNQSIKVDASKYAKYFISNVEAVVDNKADESWHVPAAERPLKRQRKSSRKPTAKRTAKTKTKKE